MSRGYTIIEALIVVALAGMILAIATYSYTPTMRSYRTKKAVQDFKTMIADAKVTAARENRNVNITSDGTGIIDVYVDENGNDALDAGTDIHMYQLVATGDGQDPGRPAGITENYHFEQFVSLTGTTRTGLTALDRGGAIGYAGEDVYDEIPFLTAFRLQARPNGFIRIFDGSGTEVPFGAVLCVHENDVLDGDISPDRHYALALALTGWTQTYRLDRDGNWVEY